MAMIVVILGIIVASPGVVGVLFPRRLIRFILSVWKLKNALLAAIVFRLIFGAALLLAAASTRFPLAIRILGVISIVAAGALPILGGKRMKLIIMWWATRSTNVIRAWSVVAIAFGALLVYAGL